MSGPEKVSGTDSGLFETGKGGDRKRRHSVRKARERRKRLELGNLSSQPCGLTNPARQSLASSRKRVLRGGRKLPLRSVDSESQCRASEPRNLRSRERPSLTQAGAAPRRRNGLVCIGPTGALDHLLQRPPRTTSQANAMQDAAENAEAGRLAQPLTRALLLERRPQPCPCRSTLPPPSEAPGSPPSLILNPVQKTLRRVVVRLALNAAPDPPGRTPEDECRIHHHRGERSVVLHEVPPTSLMPVRW